MAGAVVEDDDDEDEGELPVAAVAAAASRCTDEENGEGAVSPALMTTRSRRGCPIGETCWVWLDHDPGRDVESSAGGAWRTAAAPVTSLPSSSS